jgi:hypothetical protein
MAPCPLEPQADQAEYDCVEDAVRLGLRFHFAVLAAIGPDACRSSSLRSVFGFDEEWNGGGWLQALPSYLPFSSCAASHLPCAGRSLLPSAPLLASG